MADRTYNLLFLCTGNSARSIIAEAILNKVGAGRFRAWSAGSQPKGQVNPHTLALLSGLGFDVTGYRSKSWNEFAKTGAPLETIAFGDRKVCTEYAHHMIELANEYRDLLSAKKKGKG